MSEPSRGHILIADDEEPIRSVMRRSLTSAGYTVEEAGDGGEALRAYRRRRPDVLVLDLFMPNQEGLETIRALRTEDPDARIVAISGGVAGKADIDMLPTASVFGAARVLAKPFTRGQLIDAIEDVRRLAA